MSTENKKTTFPSLRCALGDWVYYITYLTFSDVAHWIKETDEIHKSQKLRDMIQREIGKRVAPIVDYIVEQKERFFNAIVVGVYEGSPKWYSIEVGESPVHGSPDLDDVARGSIGLLTLEGDEKLFAIDGQHRVVAIGRALKRKPMLESEQLCAIFVAHSSDQLGMMRTRRLFSTLNRYAVPVSTGEIVALSEDDAFAIVTRRLVEDFALLKSDLKDKPGFVYFGKTSNIVRNDNSSLTSVLALYDVVRTIQVPISIKLTQKDKEEYQRLRHRRPTDQQLNSIYKRQTTYWELLRDNIPEYKKLFDSKPEEKIAGRYRTATGGHVMFRPIGQKAFARAARIMIDRGKTIKEAVSALSSVPLNLSAPPWRKVMWNPSTRRVNSKVSSKLTESLFLHYVGQPPRDDYPVLDEYRKVLDEPNAVLPKASRG